MFKPIFCSRKSSHDIINLSIDVAGWSDDLMARPKAKAKASAAGSPAPPVASSRIGLALHRRPQVPPSASNVAPPVASNVAPPVTPDAEGL